MPLKGPHTCTVSATRFSLVGSTRDSKCGMGAAIHTADMDFEPCLSLYRLCRAMHAANHVPSAHQSRFCQHQLIHLHHGTAPIISTVTLRPACAVLICLRLTTTDRSLCNAQRCCMITPKSDCLAPDFLESVSADG